MGFILIVDDKDSMARMLSMSLAAEGYEVKTARSAKEAMAQVLKGGIELVVTDLKMPGESGLDLLSNIKDEEPLLPVILMTAYGSIDTAVKAVKLGAYDFLVKPFDPDHLILLINRALERQKLLNENILLREELSKNTGFPTIVGRSQPLMQVVEYIKKAAFTTASVLLEGESGTGKEVFAKSLHMLSPRAKRPFIAVNCAAIPKDLIESELFGHEKGSFTGANSMRIGKFELADKGTIFLDEIGDMDIGIQAKLLRVLEEYEITRVGGSSRIKVDVRVISATNKDLKVEVKEGAFREDLYFRISVLPIRIPPLRERSEDIIPLAEHFITTFCKEMKKKLFGISEQARDEMKKHDWPGNIRELKNMIERAIILGNSNIIQPEDTGLSSKKPKSSTSLVFEGTLHEATTNAVKIVEREMIKKVLKETRCNKSKAAKILQVSYKTLLTKIKEMEAHEN